MIYPISSPATTAPENSPTVDSNESPAALPAGSAVGDIHTEDVGDEETFMD